MLQMSKHHLAALLSFARFSKVYLPIFFFSSNLFLIFALTVLSALHTQSEQLADCEEIQISLNFWKGLLHL